jgi:uncharacterized membrane protein YhhN
MSIDFLPFGVADRALLLLSVICSFFYLATQSVQPYPGGVLLKVLSVAPLAAIAFRTRREPSATRGVGRSRDRDNLILAMALAFSSLGDALLDLDPERLFIKGLLAFLAAHLVYILLFVRNRARPLRPKLWRLALVAAVLIYSLLLSLWLAPSLGAMAAPVMIYVCVITVMAVSAILARFSKPWVYTGVILFLISDSILAVDKFKSPVPLRGYLIWTTYYLAQCGIAIGFLREKSGDK